MLDTSATGDPMSLAEILDVLISIRDDPWLATVEQGELDLRATLGRVITGVEALFTRTQTEMRDSILSALTEWEQRSESRLASTRETIANAIETRSLSASQVELITKAASALENSANSLKELYGFEAEPYLQVLRELASYAEDPQGWTASYGSLDQYLANINKQYNFRGLVGLDIAYQVQLVQSLVSIRELENSRDKILATIDQSGSAVKSLAAAALNVEQRYQESLIEAAALNEQIKNGADLAQHLGSLLTMVSKAMPALETCAAILQERMPVDTQTKDALRSIADQMAPTMKAVVRLAEHAGNFLPFYDTALGMHAAADASQAVKNFASLGPAKQEVKL